MRLVQEVSRRQDDVLERVLLPTAPNWVQDLIEHHGVAPSRIMSWELVSVEDNEASDREKLFVRVEGTANFKQEVSPMMDPAGVPRVALSWERTESYISTASWDHSSVYFERRHPEDMPK